jgi:hypothetical protein
MIPLLTLHINLFVVEPFRVCLLNGSFFIPENPPKIQNVPRPLMTKGLFDATFVCIFATSWS